MKLTPDQISKINEDFPPEALSKDTSRGFELTSIKAAFVIERLNDVFGHLGWCYRFTDPMNHDGEFVTQVTLIIKDEDIDHEIKQFGGKKMVKTNVTDAMKSAVTDGLTKCASILGIGHKVFKGMVKVGDKPKKQPDKQPDKAPDPDGLITAPQLKKINTMITNALLERIQVKLLLKVASLKDLTQDRASNLIEKWDDFVEVYENAQKEGKA
jgi:hypothetical protein